MKHYMQTEADFLWGSQPALKTWIMNCGVRCRKFWLLAVKAATVLGGGELLEGHRMRDVEARNRDQSELGLWIHTASLCNLLRL